MDKFWSNVQSRILTLAVGEEYPVPLVDGTATVAREAPDTWRVAVAIASHPDGVFTAEETYSSAHEALGAVGALL